MCSNYLTPLTLKYLIHLSTLTRYIATVKGMMHIILCKIPLNIRLGCIRYRAQEQLRDLGSWPLPALLNTMKISSIPITCYLYIVSITGRRISRRNSEDLDKNQVELILKITSFQFVSCFLSGGLVRALKGCEHLLSNIKQIQYPI